MLARYVRALKGGDPSPDHKAKGGAGINVRFIWRCTCQAVSTSHNNRRSSFGSRVKKHNNLSFTSAPQACAAPSVRSIPPLWRSVLSCGARLFCTDPIIESVQRGGNSRRGRLLIGYGSMAVAPERVDEPFPWGQSFVTCRRNTTSCFCPP